MAKCELCGKSPQSGRRVAHSKLATKRLFRPNLQKTTIIENGRRRQIVVCAKCLKALSKAV